MEQTLTQTGASDAPVSSRRWWILLTLCLSLLIIGLDNLILNVALPSIQHDLNASASDLQWTVDGYALIFASLLLTTGSLGDRFGRKLALNVGLLCFGIGSVGAALSATIGQLIAMRVVMGFGAALIMPSTLSIITNVFPAKERGRAISIWAGVAALGIPLGPVLGGFLLEHYSWGSVFLINVPIVLIALVVGWFLVPESRDPQATPPDLLGAVLSIGGLVTFVYGFIEAPQKGWTGQIPLTSWAIAAAVLGAFIVWELRAPHPMLPMEFFRLRQFNGAILGVLLLGFGLFGSFFLLTQYLQYVRGYTPLEAGIRLLPIIAIIIGTQVGTRLSERIGIKFVIPIGLVFIATCIYLLSRLETTSSDAQLLWTITFLGFSMGTVVAPSATTILGSVPVGRAGIGSAMTTVGQQLGGALGVAVLGSLLNTNYSANIDSFTKQLPPMLPIAIVKGSLNGALAIAQHIGGPLGAHLILEARLAYTDAMSSVLVAAAIIALASAVIVAFILPRHRTEGDAPPHTEGGALI
jgi:EmrB/QacA subfamily drug resistance transporter